MAELWRHGRNSQELRLLAVILAMATVLSLVTPGFASAQNLMDMLTTSAFTGILAVGLLVVLIAGGVDISFAATASITQYVALTLANQGHLGWPGVVLVAMGVGSLLGVLNALLVTTLGMSSIIVTIATQSLFYGLLMAATKGQDIFALPDWFNAGLHWVIHVDAKGSEQALNLQIMLLLGVSLFTGWMLTRTSIGRQICAMGGNPEAARRIGFPVFRLNLLVYGFMGTVAGLASLVHAQMVQSVSPSALVGRELDVLAAVVLGGASLNGGIGSVPGCLLGVALLAVLQNGLTLLGVSSYWSQLCTGGVIIAAVVMMAHQQQQKLNQKKAALA
jgi:simple sugar transport system permease protein